MQVANFDAPDAHFDLSNLFSDAQIEKSWKSGIKM
jgi:hypothetical protein